jgi:hypothetical protein
MPIAHRAPATSDSQACGPTTATTSGEIMKRPQGNQSLCRAALLGGLLAPLMSVHAEDIRVTPYRPTIANPADLSAPGYLEVEMGVAHAHDRSAQTRATNSPMLLKYAINEDLGFLIGTDGHVRQRNASGDVQSGWGDSSAALKLRKELTDSSGIGVELGARFASASNGVGQAGTDYAATGIYSIALGKLAVDVNLGATRVASTGVGEGRYRYGGAIAMGAPIAGPIGFTVELSSEVRRGFTGSSQGLAALTWEINRKLVLDLGFARTLDRSKVSTVFAGFSWLITR